MEHNDLPSTKAANEKILTQYCAPPFQVTLMKDKEGNIGGYMVNRTDVMDTPVTYFDAQGEPLASFHIFASDAEKKAASSKIDELRKRFPLESRVDCSKYKAGGR